MYQIAIILLALGGNFIIVSYLLDEHNGPLEPLVLSLMRLLGFIILVSAFVILYVFNV